MVFVVIVKEMTENWEIKGLCKERKPKRPNPGRKRPDMTRNFPLFTLWIRLEIEQFKMAKVRTLLFVRGCFISCDVFMQKVYLKLY